MHGVKRRWRPRHQRKHNSFHNRSRKTASTSASASPAPQALPTLNSTGVESVPSAKARQSLPATFSKPANTPQPAKESVRSVSEKQSHKVVVKAVAAEWGDSDSDDSDAGWSAIKNVSLTSDLKPVGWTSVNGSYVSPNAVGAGSGESCGGLEACCAGKERSAEDASLREKQTSGEKTKTMSGDRSLWWDDGDVGAVLWRLPLSSVTRARTSTSTLRCCSKLGPSDLKRRE